MNICLDEDVPRRKTTLDAFLKTPSPSKPKQKTTTKDTSKDTKTPVSVSDFFGGSSSVKRSDRKTIASKRKLVHVTKSFNC